MNGSSIPSHDGVGEPDGGLVELVDDRGRGYDVAPKLAAHRPPGQLHRAISVFLVDERGRLLLQRRADTKYHSAGLWSNSCCSHPAPGEAPVDAATRRVAEELGIRPLGLVAAGTVRYEVIDPVSGLVEREWNHLFVGRAGGDPAPDPREVADWAAMLPEELAARLPDPGFSAWLPVVLEAVLPSLRQLTGERQRR